jgi:hypothetical protein
MGVRARGEGGDLFVANVQPFDPAAAENGVGEAVQTIADDAVDAPDASGGENLNHLVGDRLGHRVFLGSNERSTIDESRLRKIGRSRSGDLSLRERGC